MKSTVETLNFKRTRCEHSENFIGKLLLKRDENESLTRAEHMFHSNVKILKVIANVESNSVKEEDLITFMPYACHVY